MQYAGRSDRNWSGSSYRYPENFLNEILPVSITGSPRGMNGRVPQARSGFAVDKFKLSLSLKSGGFLQNDHILFDIIYSSLDSPPCNSYVACIMYSLVSKVITLPEVSKVFPFFSIE